MKSIATLVAIMATVATTAPCLSVAAATGGSPGNRMDSLVSMMSEIRAGDSSVIPLDSAFVKELFAAPRRDPLADTPTLVLSKQSVNVTVTWKNLYVNPPTTGTATALQQDDTYGFFYFFGASNPEVLVKVLDGFPDGKYRVFYAGLTTLEFTVNVQVFCGAAIISSKTFSKPFDGPGTSTNTGGTDGTLAQGCQTTPFPLASGVSTVYGAGGR